MRAGECEIVVYVRTRRVVVAAQEIRGILPCATGFSPPLEVPVRRVSLTFGRRLDRGHGQALVEAFRLAAQTAISIRVVDLGRRNVLVRAVRLWLLGSRALPVVIVRGSCPWARGVREESPSPRVVRA